MKTIQIAIPSFCFCLSHGEAELFATFPTTDWACSKSYGACAAPSRTGFIALNGEAGYQPKVVRGGVHFFMPFQYAMHRANLVTIPQGQIGYVFARDGKPLPPTQTLASNVEADDFQDVREFLTKGGQKGPQRKILREGTYAINLAQFIVLTAQSTYAIQSQRKRTEALRRHVSADPRAKRLRTGHHRQCFRHDRYRDRA